MGGNTEISGPNFADGIDAASLTPGSKLLGHVGGEAVLLARVGDEYFAVGATCTHYGGPLPRGGIDGGTDCCPRDHARFNPPPGGTPPPPPPPPLPCRVPER